MQKIFLIAVMVMLATVVHAQQSAVSGLPDLTTNGLNSQGFEKIAPFADKLTPEQKTAILQSIMMLKSQWDNMPKDQQQNFLKQLMNAYSKFDFKNADPNLLDMNKMQDLGAVKKDIDGYLQQQKNISTGQ